MKWFIALLVVLVFEGCGPTAYLIYSRLTPEIEDSTVKIDFFPGEDKICLGILNKSTEPIGIVWDECSIILDGVSKKIFHTGVRFMDRAASLPPSIIPPKASLQECIIPSENVSMGNYGWNIQPLGSNNVRVFVTVDKGGGIKTAYSANFAARIEYRD